MIESYFDTDQAAREDMLQELGEWEGTPFMLRHSSKGKRCDCVLTINDIFYRVFAGLGILTPVTIPLNYRIRTNSNEWLYFLCEKIEESGPWSRVFENHDFEDGLFSQYDFELLKFGDLLVFGNGKGIAHLGVYVGDDKFYHAKIRRCFAKSTLMGTEYQNGIYRIYRLKG